MTPEQSQLALSADLKYPPSSQAETSLRNLKYKDSEKGNNISSPPFPPQPNNPGIQEQDHQDFKEQAPLRPVSLVENHQKGSPKQGGGCLFRNKELVTE